MTSAVRLRGPLDVAALRESLRDICGRHQILRTVYFERNGTPLQSVCNDHASLPFVVQDTESLTEQVVDEAFGREWSTPIRLDRDWPVRFTLLRCSPDHHVLLHTFHHIAFDGWSRGIFNRELSHLYRVRLAHEDGDLPPLALQYRDYALRQRRQDIEHGLDDGIDFWRSHLEGAPDKIDLGAARAGFNANARGAVWRSRLESQGVSVLKQFSRNHRVTPYTTLLLAFGALLFRHTGQRDLVIGSPVANRPFADLRSLIGFFANTVALRIQIPPRASFEHLLSCTRSFLVDAFAHDNVPFERVVQELAPHRQVNLQPLAQVTFALQNSPVTPLALNNVATEVIEPTELRLGYALSLHVRKDGDGIALSWRYDSSLFKQSEIDEISRHYLRLLEGAMTAPASCIEAIPLLSSRDRKLMLERSVGRTLDVTTTEGTNPLALFEDRAARASSDPALESAHAETLTYGELDKRACRLASVLRSQGVSASTRVGVILPRSVDLPVALLAILKLGATYVAIDPFQPALRQNEIIRHSEVGILLAPSSVQDLMTHHQPLPCCYVDSTSNQDALIAQDPATNGAAPAYIIYTSGSSGSPKGVAILRRSLGHYIRALPAALPEVFSARYLSTASPAFSSIIRQVLLPLSHGGTVLLPPRDVVADPAALLAFVIRSGAGVLDIVPTLFRALVRQLESDRQALAVFNRNSRLRTVLLASETLPADLVRRWQALNGGTTQVFNMYGQTETTGIAAVHAIGASSDVERDIVPLGRPIPGTAVYVLDEFLQPLPSGVEGDLYVGGATVGAGYISDPELTRKHFIPNPHAASGALYRTGDRGVYTSDGILLFRGRADRQIKIRGMRVEPAELESALRLHDSVLDAVVLGDVDDGNGNAQLHAYIIPRSHASFDANLVRAHVAARLPHHLLPSTITAVDQWPLTTTGKVDFRALRLIPHRPHVETQAVAAPSSSDEEALSALFARVLKQANVGVDDDFFAIGGHSLQVPQLVSEIRHAFHVEVPLRTVFEAPTARQLARAIGTTQRRSRQPLVALGERQDVALSREQRMCLACIDRLGADPFNLVGALDIRGTLDTSRFEQAVQLTIARHPILRTVYPHGLPPADRQGRVGEWRGAAIPYTDLSKSGSRAQQEHIAALLLEEAVRPLDFAAHPPFRLRLLRCAADHHVLVRTLHAIAADTWSARLFNKDLWLAYRGPGDVTTDRSADSVQFADFAAWQTAWLDETTIGNAADHWATRLAGANLARLFRSRHETDMTPRSANAVRSVVLQPDAAALLSFSASHGVTSQVTLLSAFAVAMYGLGFGDDLLIGVPTPNRMDDRLGGVIGPFENILPVRCLVDPRLRFSELQTQVQKTVQSSAAVQDIPFPAVVEKLYGSQTDAYLPFFKIVFAHYGSDGQHTLDHLTATTRPPDGIPARNDIQVLTRYVDKELRITYRYDEAVINPGTIQVIADLHHRLLHRLQMSTDTALSGLL